MREGKSALFVVAHPDDAEIVAGGTIAWLRSQGIQVTVVVATISEYVDALRPTRRKAAELAARRLDYDLQWIQDGDLNQVEDLAEYRWVRLMDGVVKAKQFDFIFSHWVEDGHGDHVRLGRAVTATMRHQSARYYAFAPSDLRNVSSNNFIPNIFIDISPFVEAKKEALSFYEYAGKSFRTLNIDAYLSANATYGSHIGVAYAEAFMLLRGIGL